LADIDHTSIQSRLLRTISAQEERTVLLPNEAKNSNKSSIP